jgi:hypothetical protein
MQVPVGSKLPVITSFSARATFLPDVTEFKSVIETTNIHHTSPTEAKHVVVTIRGYRRKGGATTTTTPIKRVRA